VSFKAQKYPVWLSLCLLIVFSSLSAWSVEAAVCGTPGTSAALHRVMLRDPAVPTEIPSAIHYLHDLNGALTWDELQQLKLDDPQWHINEKRTRTFDPGVYWFAFSVQNQSDLNGRWILESDNSALGQVDVYIRSSTQKDLHWQSGYQRPMAERAIWHRDHLFPLMLSPCETVQIYIRVQDDFRVKLPLKVWEKSAYQQKNQLMTLFWACCLGMLGVMLLQHLLMFSAHRDVSYLYYSGFIGAVMLFVFTYKGLTYQFLWPKYNGINAEIVTGSVLFMVIFFVMFTIELLNLKEKSPLLRRILLGFVACNIVLLAIRVGPFQGLIDYQKIRGICNLLLMLTMFGVGLYRWHSGDRVARNYSIALSILFVNSLVVNLHLLGLVPSSFIAKNSIAIGFIFEAILQALVLSARFNDLRARRFHAQASARAKNHFLSNMSREIRTPLNAIVGYSSLARSYSSQKISKTRAEYLRKTETACGSLLALVSDILKLSKMGHDMALKLDSVEFDVQAFFAELSDMFAGIARQKPVDIVFSIDNAVPRILIGDPMRIGQVLISRINSAIEHTHRGEILITVKRSSTSALAYENDSGEQVDLTFSVRDTGSGMPKATYMRLVEQLEGDGLDALRSSVGLRICNQLVKLMGGSLHLEVDGGLGCTCYFDVRFDLPRIAAMPVLAEELALPDLWIERSRVLLIDDNSVLGDFLTRAYITMGLAGRQVSYVRTLEDALSLVADAYAQGTPYTLVMLDASRDVVSTERVLKRLQQADSQILMTVLLMLPSGYAEAFECSQLQGVARVVHKPLNVFDLHDVLLDCLSAKYAECANHVGVTNHESVETFYEEDILAEAVARHIGGSSVLLVEDNHLNRDLAMVLLEELGLQVTWACNGVEALEAVQQHSFAAILMDIQMPVMDGLQATREIRQLQQVSKLPIIAVTAGILPHEKERCYQAGMDDLIAKPIDSEVLYQCLLQWIAPGVEPLAVLEEYIENPNTKVKLALKNEGEIDAGIKDGVQTGVTNSATLLPIRPVPQKEPQTKDADASHARMTGLLSREVLNFELPLRVPGINLEDALARIHGNQPLLLTLLNDFINDSADLMEEIHRTQADNDWQKLRYLLDSLRGSASSLSADTLVQAALSLASSMPENGPANLDVSLFRVFELALVEALSSARCVLSFTGESAWQDLAVPDLDASPVSADLDRRGLALGLEELTRQIQNNDLGALVTVEHLQNLLAGSSAASILLVLHDNVLALNYRQAQDSLGTLVEQLASLNE